MLPHSIGWMSFKGAILVRVVKQGTILGSFDIKYLPQTAIKGQVLADLVVEFIECTEEGGSEEGSHLGMKVLNITTLLHPIWELYVGGASNKRGQGVGIFMISLQKFIVAKSLRLSLLTTNNKAEYEALLVVTGKPSPRGIQS